MESYQFLLVLAIILLSTKILGLLSEKVHMPQVVGALLAGLIMGPSVLGMVTETDFLAKTAELGVIMLMFTAGMDTDLQELKKTGAASLVIALIGVVVPLAGGFATYYFIYSKTPDPHMFMKAIFMGVILTATSVSITVETLREMGKLQGKIGTTILGAAIIDDILGIIVLTIVTGFIDPNVQFVQIFARLGGFFLFLAVIGFLVYKLFSRMDVAYGKKRRIAIYAFVFCLLLSFIAEEYFGIADITGAYFAGLLLCNLTNTREYIAKKVQVSAYMLFSPVFFASIGFKTTITGFTSQLVLFCVIMLIVALLSKVVGCGLGAKLCGFTNHEALCVGIGMISRGEVALVVAQKGAQSGLISPELFPAIVIVVIVTTLITPILLKLVMAPNTAKAA